MVFTRKMRSLLLLLAIAASQLSGTTAQESFGSYMPSTDVSDHAAIALDQSELEYAITEKRMGLPGATYDDLLATMLSVYRNGGNSRPYAVLTLDDDTLSTTVEQGTTVTLVAEGAIVVHGTLLETVEANAQRISVVYQPTDGDPANMCRVGFLLRPSTEHCFPETGTVRIGNDDDDDEAALYYEYTYVPTEDNLADRTIQQFSTDTSQHHVLGHDTNPLHATMAKFRDYYGVVDYADRIVEAALTKSNAGLNRGNLDFTGLAEDDLAGAEAAMKGTVVLHMLMMVFRELEHSLDLCATDFTDDDEAVSVEDEPVRALDKAVAYYMGSLEGNTANNSTDSHMLYYIADSICADFNTCEDEGQSFVNEIIFVEFDDLQEIYEMEEDCEAAQDIIEEDLIQQLYVPLVQTTLFYAFKQDIEEHSSARYNAEGAMFTASILPFVHACNADDAEIIYQQMQLGGTAPDFFAVKNALERNYECMGLSCFDIGGVFIDGDYYPGAEPCEDDPEMSPASVDDDASQVVTTFEPLGSYTPSTDIASYAAIALDQAEMEYAVKEKEMGIPDTYEHLLETLLSVYRNGGNARPYAQLTLSEPLKATVLKGTPVSLIAEEVDAVHGELLETAEAGERRIAVLYKVDGNQNNMCRAGFLLRPSTEHCFPEEGTIRVGTSDDESFYEYSYLPKDDNLSDATIQRFSTDFTLHHAFGEESNPLHASMAMFEEYYGVVDYADRIVEAALTQSNAGLQRGNMDFTDLGEEDLAGAEAAMEGTVVLHMFMMVLRELEHSLDLCESDLNDDLDYEVEDDPAHALDRAVAYYTGSLQGNIANNSTDGHLLHYIAELFCVNFNTCEDGQSRVSRDLFFEFDVLQEAYEDGAKECTTAGLIVEESIKTQLYVPLVQGTLFFAYERYAGDSSAKRNAEGAMFAASILPLVHACSEEDAEVIYEQMQLGGAAPDFVAVKHAFERNYECMGLSCVDIGGVFDNGEYLPEGEPCFDDDTVEPDDDMIGATPAAPASSPTADSTDDSQPTPPTTASSRATDSPLAAPTNPLEESPELLAVDVVIAVVLFAIVIGCVIFTIRCCCCKRCRRRANDTTKDGVIVDKAADTDFEEVDLQASNHIIT